MINVKFQKTSELAHKPVKANETDAGFDLFATEVEMKENYLQYKTGLKVMIPEGYVGLLFPRSSVTKRDLMLKNSVGIIDSGYRGEIMLRFHRTQKGKIYDIGERLGQLVIMPIPQVNFEEVRELEKSERGEGGFGSTGNSDLSESEEDYLRRKQPTRF